MDGFVLYFLESRFVKSRNNRRIEAPEVAACFELLLNDATNVVQKVVLQADHADSTCTYVVGYEIDLLFGERVHLVVGILAAGGGKIWRAAAFFL